VSSLNPVPNAINGAAGKKSSAPWKNSGKSWGDQPKCYMGKKKNLVIRLIGAHLWKTGKPSKKKVAKRRALKALGGRLRTRAGRSWKETFAGNLLSHRIEQGRDRTLYQRRGAADKEFFCCPMGKIRPSVKNGGGGTTGEDNFKTGERDKGA